MWTECLTGKRAFTDAAAHTHDFIGGAHRAVRLAALEQLGLPPGVAAMPRAMLDIDDPGTRAIAIDMPATHHANLGEGAIGAGIASALLAFFRADLAAAADETRRAIGRKAIASAATTFSYAALRAGCHEDPGLCADRYAAELQGWRLTDAAATLETLAAEGLYEQGWLDPARARLPAVPPGDDAGRVRWQRLQRLLRERDPDDEEPTLPERYDRALEEMKRLLEQLRRVGMWREAADALAKQIAAEEAEPPGENNMLERILKLKQFLAESMRMVSEAGPGAIGR